MSFLPYRVSPAVFALVLLSSCMQSGQGAKASGNYLPEGTYADFYAFESAWALHYLGRNYRLDWKERLKYFEEATLPVLEKLEAGGHVLELTIDNTPETSSEARASKAIAP